MGRQPASLEHLCHSKSQGYHLPSTEMVSRNLYSVFGAITRVNLRMHNMTVTQKDRSQIMHMTREALKRRFCTHEAMDVDDEQFASTI
jgi:hypothetical protein